MSDGGFNLGFALAVVDYVEPGVYVAMHGHIFESNEIIKFASEGRFASIRE